MAVGLAIGAMAVCLAGLVQGCTGFGLALVATPCLMLLLPPVAAVRTVVLISTLNTMLVAFEARRHVRLGIVVPLGLGGMLGFMLGDRVLRVADPAVLKVCVGVFVILFAVALLSGWRKPLRNDKWARFPVGVAGGFLGGSTSMGGPPIILFLANQEVPKDVFRANIVCHFFIVNCFGVTWYGLSGALTDQVIGHAAGFLLPMVLGTYVGVKLARRVPEGRFRRLVVAGVAVMGVVLIISGIRALS